MCAPAVVASVAVTAAATGYKMYAEKQAGDYNAQVARNNAQLEKGRQAADLATAAQTRGQVAANIESVSSSAVAAAGVSGVSSTTGSVAGSIASTQVYGRADTERIRAEAARKAWGVGQGILGLERQAESEERKALMSGIGTGLSGLGQIIGSV